MPIADSTGRTQKRATAVRIPSGLPDMSNIEAALAYAKAGVHVLPARGKKPGGYVGAGWQDKSSRDPEQISAWWEQWPEANIAAHLGPSGLIAFDRDKVANLSALPEPYRSQLGRARFQETRPHGSRGHYLFRVRKSDRFSNSPGGFSAFGDVRGANGVIILEPSTHADGGRYHWSEPGPVPKLPDDLRALLTAALEHEPTLPNADLEAFLDTYTKANRPAALKGPLTWFRKEIADGGGRHQSLLEAASWAFREVFAGCGRNAKQPATLMGASCLISVSVDGGADRHITPFTAQRVARLGACCQPSPPRTPGVPPRRPSAGVRRGRPGKRWRPAETAVYGVYLRLR